MSRTEARFQVLVLRLLSQVLIKLHAGKQWGVGDKEMLDLTTEAGDEADDIAREHGFYEAPASDRIFARMGKR